MMSLRTHRRPRRASRASPLQARRPSAGPGRRPASNGAASRPEPRHADRRSSAASARSTRRRDGRGRRAAARERRAPARAWQPRPQTAASRRPRPPPPGPGAGRAPAETGRTGTSQSSTRSNGASEWSSCTDRRSCGEACGPAVEDGSATSAASPAWPGTAPTRRGAPAPPPTPCRRTRAGASAASVTLLGVPAGRESGQQRRVLAPQAQPRVARPDGVDDDHSAILASRSDGSRSAACSVHGSSAR